MSRGGWPSFGLNSSSNSNSSPYSFCGRVGLVTPNTTKLPLGLSWLHHDLLPGLLFAVFCTSYYPLAAPWWTQPLPRHLAHIKWTNFSLIATTFEADLDPAYSVSPFLTPILQHACPVLQHESFVPGSSSLSNIALYTVVLTSLVALKLHGYQPIIQNPTSLFSSQLTCPDSLNDTSALTSPLLCTKDPRYLDSSTFSMTWPSTWAFLSCPRSHSFLSPPFPADLQPFGLHGQSVLTLSLYDPSFILWSLCVVWGGGGVNGHSWFLSSVIPLPLRLTTLPLT